MQEFGCRFSWARAWYVKDEIMKRMCAKQATEKLLVVAWFCLLPVSATILHEAKAEELAFQRLFNFSFSDDHTQPGSLVQGTDGFLYGTTSRSTPGTPFTNDTVFKLAPQGEVTLLASFPRDGTNAYGPGSLVRAVDGNFYGVNAFGGPGLSHGSVFKLSPSGDVLTTVVTFHGADGRQPNLLIQGADGLLYGTTAAGGTHGYGTVFKLTLNGELTSLFSFARTNGANPRSLVRSADGTLYGTTTDNVGFPAPDIVFKLNSSGEFTTLLSSFNESEVFRPRRLVYATNGCVYGLDAAGGSNHFGTIFKLTPGDAFTTVVTFNGLNGLDPETLVQGMDGNLYGTTEFGGPDYNGSFPSGSGTIFKMTLDGVLTTLASRFELADAFSVNSLIQGADGNLYGTTESGGPPDPAGIFRVAPCPVVTRLQKIAGQDVLTWTAFVGGRYQVEQKPTFSTTEWAVVPNLVTAVGHTASATNNAVGSVQQYYRVRLLP